MNAQLLAAISSIQTRLDNNSTPLSSLSDPAQPGPPLSIPVPPPTAQAEQYDLGRPKHILPKPEYVYKDTSLYAQFRGLLFTKVYGVDAQACGSNESERV